MVARRYEISLTVFNSTSHLRKYIFQEQGENWPVANLLVVDFRSRLDCSICRKESEKLHD